MSGGGLGMGKQNVQNLCCRKTHSILEGEEAGDTGAQHEDGSVGTGDGDGGHVWLTSVTVFLDAGGSVTKETLL